MAGPRRSPVRIESYLLNTIGICWPKITNKKIRLQMTILGEMLQEELNKKNGKPTKQIENAEEIEYSEGEEVRYFIAYFRDRYVQETDIEYKTKIAPDEIGIIKAAIKKLKDKSVTIKEYLSWVFDDFFDDDSIRKKFTPVIKVVCAGWVMAKFFMTNRERIRKRVSEEERKDKRQTIREHAKALFEKTNDEEIKKALRREDQGTITTDDLETFLSEYEEESSTEEPIE
jgi:hypothetical protein